MSKQQTLASRLAPANERVRAAVRGLFAAQEEKRNAETDLKREIACALGHDNFEITNIVCASGFGRHVYSPTTRPQGVGQRKCLFCECDDFDL